jgi:hypothetical protein
MKDGRAPKSPSRRELLYKSQRLLQIVRWNGTADVEVLGVLEIVCTRFVRKPDNRGIRHISGILNISNLSVFSADDGFDSRRLHQLQVACFQQLGNSDGNGLNCTVTVQSCSRVCPNLAIRAEFR